MTSTVEQNKTQNVHVMLLIEGGHQCELSLASDAPLLRDLLQAIASRDRKETAPSQLFQIPMEEGGTTLYFPSESIVAIATEPPVSLSDLSNPQPTPVAQVPPPEPKKPPTPILLESRYLQIDNFLPPAEHDRLVNYVFQRKPDFVDSKVGNNDPTYRRSKILYYFDDIAESIKNRVRNILPDVLEKFNIPTFAIGDLEAQITAHNDGHYYKVHNDNGDSATAHRVLSYVYYFYREPKPFTSGELRIYDTWKIGESLHVQAESFTMVEPRNNSIVFFFSSYCHEVMPVSCPSQAFEDSRFTFNGWVSQKS